MPSEPALFSCTVAIVLVALDDDDVPVSGTAHILSVQSPFLTPSSPSIFVAASRCISLREKENAMHSVGEREWHVM